MFFNRRLSSKALLGFRYRHTVGLVGLCNRIFHTTVYRLLLFYIGNASCIFNCPGGVRNPSLYITACFKTNQNAKKNSHDCSLSMQSGSQLLFCPAFSWWYSGCHMYCIYCKGILIWQINCFINNLHAYLELALPSCFFESNRYHCKIMFIFLPLKWISYTFLSCTQWWVLTVSIHCTYLKLGLCTSNQ